MMRSLSKRGWIRVASYIAAAMLVLVGYCISIYQSNLAYRRTITNSYLRAFSQVVASVDRIDSTMQKELYVVTPAMVSVLSAEIQAEAATAQEALGELPYANIELEQTAAFLAKVGIMPPPLPLRRRQRIAEPGGDGQPGGHVLRLLPAAGAAEHPGKPAQRRQRRPERT